VCAISFFTAARGLHIFKDDGKNSRSSQIIPSEVCAAKNLEPG